MMKNKAQTKNSKFFGIFLMLVLCVVFVLGATVFTDVLTPTGTTENSSVEIEYNITEANLKEVKFHWNGTNFTIFDENLVLAYNFNNLSSLGENDTHVVDISGNGNNGTVKSTDNATFISGGKYDGAIDFNGQTNGFIDLGNPTTLNFTDNFTVSLWVNPNTDLDDVSRSVFVSGRYFDGSGWGFNFGYTGSNDAIEFRINGNDGASTSMYQSTELPVGNWTYLTLVFNNTVATLYYNGASTRTEDFDAMLISDTRNWLIGAGNTGNSNRANVSIDEVRIWNKSLQSSEIRQLYLSNLKKFDEDSWSLYVNQSNLTTNTTGITYNYFSCATNSSDSENCTSTQTITRVPISVTTTANFSTESGEIKSSFYGTNNPLNYVVEGSTIDTNGDGTLDTSSNFTWHSEAYLDMNAGYARMDGGLEFFYSNTSNPDGVNLTGNLTRKRNQVVYANENNKTILLIISYMPEWLADSNSQCSSDNTTCEPSNYTIWENIVLDYLNNITQGGVYASSIEIEVWNEPYGGFLLKDLPSDHINKSLAYNRLYNSTYTAIKSVYPNMAIIGPAGFYTKTNMMNGFLSNFSDRMDGVSIHPYKTSFLTESIMVDVNNITATCAIYNANCSRIILSEWSTDDSALKNTSSRVNEYGANIGNAYLDLLNSNAVSNISNIIFTWTKNQKYANTSVYNGYPQKYNFVSEPLLDNEFTPVYNVTKNFATYHSTGSTVYTSTTTSSAVKAVSTKNGTDSFITVINTDTEARNITVDTDGNVTNLYNLETGQQYTGTPGVFNIGVLDAYEIVYLGNNDNITTEVITLEDGTYTNNETVFFSIWLRAVDGLKSATIFIYNYSGSFIGSIYEVFAGNPTERLWNVSATLPDGIYTWFVNVTDSNDENFTSATREFTINTTFPVTLNSPANNTIESSPITFNCSAEIPSNFTTGNILQNISLWHNFTGTFVLNETISVGHTGENFSAESEVGGISGLAWNGTSYFVTDSASDEVYEYDSNGTYTGFHFDTNAVVGSANGITWDGTNFWIISSTATVGDNKAYKYTAAGAYTGTSFSLNGELTFAGGITWDGTNFSVVSHANDRVYRYTSVGVYTGFSFDVSSESTRPEGITWDGTRFFVVDPTSNNVFEYNSSGSYTGDSYNINSQATNGKGITWVENKFWVGDSASEFVYAYANLLPFVTFTKTISTNETIDGVWNCEACNTNNGCSFSSQNSTLKADDSGPVITVEAPVGIYNYTYVGNDETLNVTFTDINLSSCWYNYNGTNISIDGCLTGVKNSTIFAIEYNNFNMTIYGNDTFGNVNSSIISWEYNLTNNSLTFPTTSVESAVESYVLNATYNNSRYGVITATLNLNGSEYLATRTGSGNNAILTSSVTMPVITTATNFSTYWTVGLTDVSGIIYYNITSGNVTVSEINFTLCDATNNDSLWNFTILNETNFVEINSTFEATFFISNPTATDTNEFSFSDTTGTNSQFDFCVGTNSGNYTADASIKLTKSGFVDKFYNYQSVILNNTTREDNLYMMIVDDSTSFIVHTVYVDSSDLVGAEVRVQRYYQGTGQWATTEILTTNYIGEAVGHLLAEDADYRFLIYVDGDLIYTSSATKITCAVTPCTVTLTIPIDVPTGTETLEDFTSLLVYGQTTNIFTYTYSDTSGDFTSARLYVERLAPANATKNVVCNNTKADFSGVMTCDVTGQTNGTYQASGYLTRDDEILTDRINGILGNQIYNQMGDDGVLWAFFIMIAIMMLGITRPSLAIIFGTIGLITVGLLGIINIGAISIIAIVAIAVIGLMRVGKE